MFEYFCGVLYVINDFLYYFVVEVVYILCEKVLVVGFFQDIEVFYVKGGIEFVIQQDLLAYVGGFSRGFCVDEDLFFCFGIVFLFFYDFYCQWFGLQGGMVYFYVGIVNSECIGVFWFQGVRIGLCVVYLFVDYGGVDCLVWLGNYQEVFKRWR